MDVVLIDLANDPLTKLYGAYRTCYTPKTPREVWDDIAAGGLSKEKIAQFVEDRLKTGHVSPLEQVVFWFGISGVSRSLSHQFVRHRIGINFQNKDYDLRVSWKPRSEKLTSPAWACASFR